MKEKRKHPCKIRQKCKPPHFFLTGAVGRLSPWAVGSILPSLHIWCNSKDIRARGRPCVCFPVLHRKRHRMHAQCRKHLEWSTSYWIIPHCLHKRSSTGLSMIMKWAERPILALFATVFSNSAHCMQLQRRRDAKWWPPAIMRVWNRTNRAGVIC